MNMSRKVILSAASITLLAAAISASAANPGDGFKNQQDSKQNFAFQEFLENGRKTKQAAPLWDTRAVSGNCAANLTLCGFSAVGLVLSCAAATWTAGALSPACATLLATTGGSCALAAGYCAQSDYVPPTRRLTGVGDVVANAPDYAVERTCATGKHVYRLKNEWVGGGTAAGRVKRVTLTCTDGTTLTFGHAGGTSSHTSTCGAGLLTAGMLLQAGTELDKVGNVCRLGAGTDETTYVGAFNGGTGGSRQDRVCAPDTNLIGAKFHMDGASEASANLLGVELLCK